jgi:hypothetical protein
MKNWQRDSVGIEIFSGGARFVKLSFRQGKLELADFGEKGLERGLPALDRMADGFGQLVPGARVKISFLGQSSQTCRLFLPPELLAAGEEQLLWEIEQKMPSPSEEYELFVNAPGKNYFLGTALRKKLVERTAVPFAKKGARDLSFSSPAFGLAALFRSSGLPADGGIGLVNLGEDFTTIMILDNGEISYASELPTPPNLLEEPEGDLAETQEILKKSLLERFGIELSTLLHLLGFRATEAGRIETVYLSGPGAGLGSLPAAIGQMGGVRVGQLATHLISFPEDEPAERWAVALGLALESLNEKPDWKSAPLRAV